MREELETLVMLRNSIFVWSKTMHPLQMRQFCLNIKFNDPIEQELHKSVRQMRADKKTYKEITDTTKLPLWKISFYLTTKEKSWSLDDWIKDYLVKDSAIYSKVDYIIDPDQRLVDRFKARGLEGNCIESIT